MTLNKENILRKTCCCQKIDNFEKFTNEKNTSYFLSIYSNISHYETSEKQILFF